MPRAFVALGANLDDPQVQVRAALAALARLPQVTLVATSSLYRTAPVGLVGQPDFINAVAALDTSLSPDDLLEALFAIERSFGRVRKEKNGPRTLDLDLLLYDDRSVTSQHLQLPHPRLHLRAFVIVPLAEIAPDCAIPGRGHVAAWLPAVANQNIERLP
jgi:2-amino-4-hydroxy-6-hydroxymethyldihydropteridine diphosphokinase